MAVLAAATAACDALAGPTATPLAAHGSAVSTAALEHTPPPSLAPTATALPPSSQPPAATPVPGLGTVELRFLDPDFVPGSVLESAAGQVVWSGGPTRSSRIWRYVPGEARPELVVDLPRRASTISDVVASAAGYAFVEVNSEEFGLGGWRIWFVERPGGPLVELDRGLAYGAGFPPTLAMDDRRIAWAAFDEPPSGDVSVLRVVEVRDPTAVTTLAGGPVRDGLLWLPALHDDELWYAILHPDWDGSRGGDEFHIEMLDLAAPGSAPARFAGTANDFHPAVSDTHIAWKTAVGDGAALNWGTVTVQDRTTAERWIVPRDDLNRPSLGKRFLAFEELTRSHLTVFDLAARRTAELLPADLAGEVFVGGQSISGSLLAFFTQAPGDRPRIGWAELPE